jgi:hypothetical protein
MFLPTGFERQPKTTSNLPRSGESPGAIAAVDLRGVDFWFVYRPNRGMLNRTISRVLQCLLSVERLMPRDRVRRGGVGEQGCGRPQQKTFVCRVQNCGVQRRPHRQVRRSRDAYGEESRKADGYLTETLAVASFRGLSSRG